MEVDLVDHLINAKAESCGSMADGKADNSWGYGNTQDFTGVLYFVCKPPVKHTPGRVGDGKSGSPMPNIFIVLTMNHIYPYQCNSSISAPSLKPQSE